MFAFGQLDKVWINRSRRYWFGASKVFVMERGLKAGLLLLASGGHTSPASHAQAADSRPRPTPQVRSQKKSRIFSRLTLFSS